MSLTWDDAYEIAVLLRRIHQGVDVAAINPSTLQGWVKELPGFVDDPERATERKLETIRTIWLGLTQSGGAAGPPAM
jgi:FeS assembly protein IscX